jgi:hypothetical protein
MTSKSQALGVDLGRLVREFESRSGLQEVEYEVKHRPDREALIIKMANPTERFYKLIETITNGEDDEFPTITLKKRAPNNRLQSPEARYFLRVLSESLNINRFSFKDEFFERYTKSVSNAEAQITALANHIVYGRRGAGKSSLLLYAPRSREAQGLRSAWIDFQTYEKRNENKVVVSILSAILDQLEPTISNSPTYAATKHVMQRLEADTALSDAMIRDLVPQVRRVLTDFVSAQRPLFIFLDDFHLLDMGMQPKFLGYLYSITRGNNVFVKLSAIETLTKSWDAVSRAGMQVPHDAQTIKLDYNLTMPDKAEKHIEGILDAHAVYCGLPSVRFLCTSNNVLSRLVWVSAGVPRDALNMFAQAITKAVTAGGSRVSVTNINVAASDLVSQKIRDLEIDVLAPEAETDLESTLEKIKDFCIKQQRKNAFLVEIRTDSELYRAAVKLVDLRLLHVISEGITVGDAGRKFLALILDYGFYTGIRAAQSVDLFNKQTERVVYKDLRKLPIMPRNI